MITSPLKLKLVFAVFNDDSDTHTAADAIFGDSAFRKINKNGELSKISKSLFDSLSVCMAWLTDNERSVLIDRKRRVKKSLSVLFQNEDFARRLSNGTGKIPNVRYRFEEIGQMLERILDEEGAGSLSRALWDLG